MTKNPYLVSIQTVFDNYKRSIFNKDGFKTMANSLMAPINKSINRTSLSTENA